MCVWKFSYLREQIEKAPPQKKLDKLGSLVSFVASIILSYCIWMYVCMYGNAAFMIYTM